MAAGKWLALWTVIILTFDPIFNKNNKHKWTVWQKNDQQRTDQSWLGPHDKLYFKQSLLSTHGWFVVPQFSYCNLVPLLVSMLVFKIIPLSWGDVLLFFVLEMPV